MEVVVSWVSWETEWKLLKWRASTHRSVYFMILMEEDEAISLDQSRQLSLSRLVLACLPAKPFQGYNNNTAGCGAEGLWCDARSDVVFSVRPANCYIIQLSRRRRCALIKCRRAINVWSHTCRQLLSPNLWPKTSILLSHNTKKNNKRRRRFLVLLLHSTRRRI